MNDTCPPLNDQPQSTEDEINLLDLLIVLAKHKDIVLGVPIIAAVIATIISLLMPNIYTATAKIMLPQQASQPSALAMLSQLGGGLGGLAGGALGIKSPSDTYVAMLKSRTVADTLIQRFRLKEVYDLETMTETRRALEDVTRINAGKDGIITVEVDDKDPKRAAELANSYAEGLDSLSHTLAVTEASQRRLFFERQLEQAKDNLARAEVTARQALDKGGLVQVEGQGRAMVENTARLRGQISVKEVQIGAMRAFASGQNPELRLAQQELEAMKRELARIEGPSGAKSVNPRETNGIGIDNLRLLRDIKYYETIYELLAKQYEIAKIDEAKDAAVIQVMDKAIEPEKKSKPKRLLIVFLTALVTSMLSIIWALINEGLERSKARPEQEARLNALKAYWKRRSVRERLGNIGRYLSRARVERNW